MARPQLSLQEQISNYEIKPSPDGRFNDCWYYTGKVDERGRGRISVDCKRYLASRVIAWYSNLLDPNDKEFTLDSEFKVLHKCDNPCCINKDHLFIGTNQDNSDDCVSKRRHHHGEKHYSHKLTEEHVIQIRKLFKEGTGKFTLAVKYGVHQNTIHQIVNNIIWTHILETNKSDA